MAKRSVLDPFTLTPTEVRILALMRAGKSHKEVAYAIGRTAANVGNAYSTAAEKERLINLHDKPEHGAGSSLSKARGAVRMAGTK